MKTNNKQHKLRCLILCFVIAMCFQNSTIAQNITNNATNQIAVDTVNIKKLKKVRNFSYPIGNESNTFGYRKYNDGSVSSVNCVKLIGNYAYLIDDAHHNLKRLNLSDGKIIVSNKNLIPYRIVFSSLGYINQTIYVFSNYDVVYLFDEDIKYKKSIILSNYRNAYPYSENKDSLVVYNMDALTDALFDGEKVGIHGLIKTKRTGILNLIKIGNDGKISNIKINADYNMYDFLYGKQNGYPGEEIPWENKFLLKIHDVFYEIPYSFRHLNRYGCIDVDNTNKYVICYKASKAKLEVTICEY